MSLAKSKLFINYTTKLPPGIIFPPGTNKLLVLNSQESLNQYLAIK